jgi:DNA-directed RNA polymerase subunit N (RpoN/RPB10)
MIIPIRCFTCGKLIADKWEYISELLSKDDKVDKGKIMNELKLDRMCCRRHIISHVDLIDKI